MDPIAIAKFGRPHGTRGEVRLWPYNPDSELYHTPRIHGWARDTSGELRAIVITALRWSDRFAIARLEGVTSREDAELLINQEYVVDRAAFPELGDDELYLVDTIGWPVFIHHEGARWHVGQVEGYAETGAQDIMRVTLLGGEGSWLVPMLDHCLEELAPERKRVILAPLTSWAVEGTTLPTLATRAPQESDDE